MENSNIFTQVDPRDGYAITDDDVIGETEEQTKKREREEEQATQITKKKTRVLPFLSGWRAVADKPQGTRSNFGTTCNAIVCQTYSTTYKKKVKDTWEQCDLHIFTVMLDSELDVQVPHKQSITEMRDNATLKELSTQTNMKYPISDKRPDVILHPGDRFSFTCFASGDYSNICIGSLIEISKLNFGVSPVVKMNKSKNSASTEEFDSDENDSKDELGDPYISFIGVPLFKENPSYETLRRKVKNTILPGSLNDYFKARTPLPYSARVPDFLYIGSIPAKGNGTVSTFTMPGGNTIDDYPLPVESEKTSNKKQFLTFRYFTSEISNEVLMSRSPINKGYWVEICNYVDFYEGLPDDLSTGGPPLICFKAPKPSPPGDSKSPYKYTPKDTTTDIPCIRGKEDKFVFGNTETSDTPFTIFQMAFYKIPKIYGIADSVGWTSISEQLFRSTRALCYFTIDEAATLEANNKIKYTSDDPLEDLMRNAPKISARPDLFVDKKTTLQWAGLEISRELALDIITKKLNRLNNQSNKNSTTVMGRVGMKENPYVMIANSPESSHTSWWVAGMDFSGNITEKFNTSCKFYAIPPNEYVYNYEQFDENEAYPETTKDYLRYQNFFEKNNTENHLSINDEKVKEMMKVMGVVNNLEIFVLHEKH